MSRMLKGVYRTIPEALVAIDNLKELGHNNEDISLVVSQSFHANFPHTIAAENILNSDNLFDEGVESPSIWSKLKGAFSSVPAYTVEDYTADSLKDILYPYRKEICAGNVAVLVNRTSHGKKYKN